MAKAQTPEQMQAAWEAGQKPAPAVALRYTGKGAVVALNIPARDLEPAETAARMTRSQYDAGLEAGIYTKADAPAADAKPVKGTPPPPAADKETP